MRTGLLGKKLGMTRIFTEDGRWIPVTLLEVGPCAVVQRKTRETDGYEAVQLGFGDMPESKCTKPERGHFKKAEVTPKRTLREFRVDESSELRTGDELKVDAFQVGDRIDVSGKTKGKGFAGVQKRHGFKGGPGGHGAHFHRAPGSIGQSADPAKVVKGKRMPGRMGNTRVTTGNVEVVMVDAEKNLLALRGTVPGATGGVVELTKQA
jgi:large subunit ribosomal protein L3